MRHDLEDIPGSDVMLNADIVGIILFEPLQEKLVLRFSPFRALFTLDGCDSINDGGCSYTSNQE